MIWKNGILKKNRLVLGLLSLTLSVLFSFFGATSRSYAATSFTFGEGGFNWASNSVNGPWINYFTSPTFTGEHNWDKILAINNNIVVANPTYTLYQYRYQGVGGGHVVTSSISASGEYASFSGQFNIVCMNINPYSVVPMCDPYDARNGIEITSVVDDAFTQSFNIESQDVNVALTWWDWDDVPIYHANLKNVTITVFFDFVIRVPRNYTGGFNITYSKPNASFISVLNPPDNHYYLYYESGQGTVSFSDDRELALMQAQNNILNRQLALQEQQQQQDAEDRSNIQNTSDNATQDGNNASSGASSATTSILGAITTIYDQLLHPTLSSCRVTGVQIYQLNLGTLDFCTGFDMPPALMAIGSIIMIGLVVLLGWSILKAGMSLYNDLLGGK